MTRTRYVCQHTSPSVCSSFLPLADTAIVCKRTLQGHSAGVLCCAIAPDGRTVVSAADDHRTLTTGLSTIINQVYAAHKAVTPELEIVCGDHITVAYKNAANLSKLLVHAKD